MKTQLRRIGWWRWVLIVVVVAIVAYVALAESLAAALLAVIAVVAALLTVWNPFAARPQPQLSILPRDEAEAERVRMGPCQTVDKESVVESARAAALAAKPLGMFLSMQGYAQPSAADHEKHEKAVAEYEPEVRSWVEAAAAWLEEQSRRLEARVVMRNPTSVDAEDAGVYVILPSGTEQCEKDEPPEPPERPEFPLRKLALGMAIDPQLSGISSWDREDGRHLPRVRPLAQKAISVREPAYERLGDGRLRVSYRRQPVRHGENEVAGRPFRVKIPRGAARIDWEVHAANLPHHASGHWQITTQPAGQGAISSLDELESALGIAEDEVD